MKKMIIFCENAVETLTYFSRQLAEAFEAWGYESFWMDFEMLGLSTWKLRQALADQRQQTEAALITFNFIGLSGEEELWDFDDEGVPCASIWEKLGIHCINIMVDHPIYYYKALLHSVSGMQAFCIDKDHAAYMKRFYPGIPCEFLPLAGNRLLDCRVKGPGRKPEHLYEAAEAETYEQWLQRPYELVFTANYVPISSIENQLQQLEPEYRDFYYEMIGAFIENPAQDLLSCMEQYIRREMPELSDAELCKAMSTAPAVDLWVRTHFREQTVRVLAEGGVPVHLFGKDWELMPCRNPENMICSGRMVNSADCIHAMASAKAALNTMPWFKDGAHDRIFTAMLHQTVALTDDSAYLRSQYTDQDTILYYSLHTLDELPQLAHSMLQQPEKLYAIAGRAMTAASQQHTWHHRAQTLRQYLP